MSLHKIAIAARLRPRLPTEQDDGSIKVFKDGDTSGGAHIAVANPRDFSQVFKFPFTSCYDHDSTQQEIFERDVKPMIDVVYSGVTVTIFAYGVTSSGKTHTMQGSKADPGVIPRVVRSMFHKRTLLPQDDVRLAVSYMEIYKDEVYDLLVERENAPKLPVRENDSGQVFVANLTSIPIDSVNDFDIIYSRATKHRSTSATNLNHASSRSHAVLSIDVCIIRGESEKMLTGKINLVDLAGSENNKLTGNDPSRMAESAAINKSLSVLGQVVHALNQGSSRIPYRNSKLTRILQDALGGSSVGLLICNLAPGVKFRQDTLNTLNFAVRTKNVENKPVVNERDVRPLPKSHFSSHLPTQPKLPPAVLQPITSTKMNGARPSIGQAPRASFGGPRLSHIGLGPRPSHVGAPRLSSHTGGPRSSLVGPRKSSGMGVRPSRVPRASGIGTAFQPFAIPNVAGGSGGGHDRNSTVGLSEKDIDERILKVVEAEVARRMEEREKEREKEEGTTTEKATGLTKETLPSGVLTPLLKKHRDLDDELKQRLHELETKLERGNKEVQMADVLSPVSKKRTGRAYVALARAHSEKGDLQVALDLYRKAESYVPDNIKLKERIIEIEWAVKNEKPFIPSPKRPKKAKSKSKSAKKSKLKSAKKVKAKAKVTDEEDEDEEYENVAMDSQADVGGIIVKEEEKDDKERFGVEVTNNARVAPGKRSLAQMEGSGDQDLKSVGVAKKQRMKVEDVDAEWTATPKKRKGRKGARAVCA